MYQCNDVCVSEQSPGSSRSLRVSRRVCEWWFPLHTLQDKPTKEFEVSAATKEKDEVLAEKLAKRDKAKKGKVVKKKM